MTRVGYAAIAASRAARRHGNKISTTVYITVEQDAALKQLNYETNVPVAEYIRQGIELVLKKYSTARVAIGLFDEVEP